MQHARIEFTGIAIDLVLTSEDWAVTQVARTADQGGVSTLTMMDHYFQMEHFATSEDPNVRRLLGAESELGALCLV